MKSKIKIFGISFAIFFLSSPFHVDADSVALKLGAGVGSDYFGLLGLNSSLGFKVGDKLYVGPMVGLGWTYVSAEVPLPNGQIDTLSDSKSGIGAGVFLEYFSTEKLSVCLSIPYHLVGLKIPYEIKCEKGFAYTFCSAKQTGESQSTYGVNALFGINYYFSSVFFTNAGFGLRITPKIGLTFSLGFGLRFLF
jgi:hypothetical protein